jgi:hypothetical protein
MLDLLLHSTPTDVAIYWLLAVYAYGLIVATCIITKET